MKKYAAAVAVVSALGMTAACGDDSNDSTDTSSSDKTTSSSTTSPSSSASDGAMDPMANLVGPGCADYAKANASGPASVEGMSQAPVATAASSNPLLKTLVAAVSGKVNPDVNLVNDLNKGEALTVFAPVDSAFAKIPADTMNSLKTGDALQTILTYHVLPERIQPNDIDGKHKTLEGETLKVTGSGDNLKVNGAAAVICGGVQTENATVYLIDSVLMPPSMR